MHSLSDTHVLLLENIHSKAREGFENAGCSVVTESVALNEDELIDRIKDVSVLGIRSKTLLTERVLKHAPQLTSVGAFCIGTNQIDLQGCANRGIPVFNAPFSNTRSVVELAIGEIIMLMRRIPTLSHALHHGRWRKSAAGSFEIRGKKLGIVGYGNIGAQLSVVAESIGMDVYYYDVVEKLALGNATKCDSLAELLNLADAVSLHVDGRPENTNFFGATEFEMMKRGSVFVNLSRGFVVDIDALDAALADEKLLGAAVDVFPAEPANNQEPFISPLMHKENVILTPHIGGSTREAQENIAQYVPARILDYIRTGSTYGSVNFPAIQLPAVQNAHRLLHVHHNVPGILARINGVLAEHNSNIVGQYLKTNETIGYLITDIDTEYPVGIINLLRDIPHTVRLKILY